MAGSWPPNWPPFLLSWRHEFTTRMARRRDLLRARLPCAATATAPALRGPVAGSDQPRIRRRRQADPAQSLRQDQSRRPGPAQSPSQRRRHQRPGRAELYGPPRRGRLAGGRTHGRSPKTIKKNENVLSPILATIGGTRLRDLTADDVHQALTAMARATPAPPWPWATTR